MKYTIKVRVTQVGYVTVDADSIEEAQEIVEAGEFDVIDDIEADSVEVVEVEDTEADDEFLDEEEA